MQSKLVLDEMKSLSMQTRTVWQIVQDALQEEMGPKKDLQHMSVHLRRKLLIFSVWSERYTLPIEWIAKTLIGHFKDARNRKSKSSGKFNRKGLPVTVNTLVSPTTELLLQRLIEEEFPEDVHISLYRQWKQDDGVRVHREGDHSLNQSLGTKNMVSFPTLGAWKRDYSKKMEKRLSEDARIRDLLKRSTRPYRGNPWK